MGINNRVVFDFDAGGRLGDLALADRAEFSVRYVDPYSILEHPDNRRTREDLVESLAASIRNEGLGQLPLVCAHPDKHGKLQHIAGWHRILAWRKVWRETGDEAYADIPVVVIDDCDDEAALRLVWATNLESAALTLEERGRAYEVLGHGVPAMREADPKGTRGVPTAEIIAGLATAAGRTVSARSVNRAMAAACREREGGEGAEGKEGRRGDGHGFARSLMRLVDVDVARCAAVPEDALEKIDAFRETDELAVSRNVPSRQESPSTGLI